MTNASATKKQLRIKRESTWGTAPGASGAQSMRRVESTLELTKDTYQSNEKRDDLQVADFRHGVRRVSGSLKGELSPGTYADLISAALRRDFAAVSAMTGLSITVAGTGPYTLTRASGSYITDGVKIGNVVRLTAGSFSAGNLNNNILVTALTATVLTGIVLNGSALVAEGPIASATLSLPGKKTYVPTTGHTDISYGIEHWFSDISQSELFTGNKVSNIDISLPPTGMATIDIGLIGKDITTNTSAYFTSPTAATTTGVTAAVNGAILVGGTQVAIITGLSLKIDPGNEAMDPVVGSNTIPGIAMGTVKVSGQFSAYFSDATLRDYFINETSISLVAAFTTASTAAADFIAISMASLKVGSAGKNDADKGIVGTYNFTALLNSAGGAATTTEQTTLAIQDSQAA